MSGVVGGPGSGPETETGAGGGVPVGKVEEVILDALAEGGWKVDIVDPDGTHLYWSTHCRHERHGACAEKELAPGVPRRPAQCKTCAAPCVCECHHS